MSLSCWNPAQITTFFFFCRACICTHSAVSSLNVKIHGTPPPEKQLRHSREKLSGPSRTAPRDDSSGCHPFRNDDPSLAIIRPWFLTYRADWLTCETYISIICPITPLCPQKKGKHENNKVNSSTFIFEYMILFSIIKLSGIIGHDLRMSFFHLFIKMKSLYILTSIF